MAELATLARPYARAAFEAARGDGDDGLERWSKMLAFLAGLVRLPEVAAEIKAPEHTDAGKAQLVVELAADEIGDKGRNFVRVLASNKRLELLPEIAEIYETLRAEHERTLDVEVVSAMALSDAELDKLKDRLTTRFSRDVAVTSRVDGSLLGGAVIRAGDTVIDGSIRGRLNKLADELRAAQ